MTPTRSCRLVKAFFTVSGPPLSPWQKLLPVEPAHTMSLEIWCLYFQKGTVIQGYRGYRAVELKAELVEAASQTASDTMGTSISCRIVARVGPHE